jgi:hypothetical protein
VPKKKPEPAPVPLLGPQTQNEWIVSTLRAIERRDASSEVREDFRTLMELYPKVATDYGDLAHLARSRDPSLAAAR